MSARIVIKRGNNLSPAKRSAEWPEGYPTSVSDMSEPVGAAMQVESGNRYWVVVADRTPAELEYLTELWVHQLTFEEITDARVRFITDSGGPFPFSREQIDQLVVKFNERFEQRISASVAPGSVAASQFVLNFSYQIPNTPANRTEAYDWVIAYYYQITLAQRRWTVSQAGLTAIQNSDYEWQDGSGTTGGRLDGNWSEVSQYFVASKT